MPSLKALEEFRYSFNQIGREDQIRVASDLPRDELPLPEGEPAPVPPKRETRQPAESPRAPAPEEAGTSPSSDDFFDFGDLEDLLGGSALDSPEPPDLGDLSDLADPLDLGNTPDLGDPQDPEIPSLDGDPGAFSDADFDLPGDFPVDINDDLSGDENPAENSGTDDGFSGVPLDDGDLDLSGFDLGAAPEEDDFSEAASGEGLDLGDLPDFSAPDLSGSEDAPEAEDFSEPSGFEETPGPEADEFMEAVSGEDLDSGLDLGDLPDFSASDFSGSEDAPEAEDFSEPSGFEETPGPEESLDLGNLPDFSALDLAETGESPKADEFPAFEEPVEPTDSLDFPDPAEALDLTEIPDFDEAPASEELSASEESLDPVDSLDLPGEIPLEEGGDGETQSEGELFEEDGAAALEAEDSPEAENSDGFDLGGEFPEAAPPAEEPQDSFDYFDLNNDSPAGEPEPKNDELGQGSKLLEEFALPGIDDVFGGKGKAGDATGEPEEIRLSDGEAARLQETLASYPLNLRIACQQIISEEVIAPDLMSNLIKLLVKGAPPKETASLAGKILGRTISIPKGFEKKTGEDLETEQSSFPYIFVHSFLPVFRLFLVVALAVVSLGYLGWKFVYTPLKGESIYRRGYERIGAGEYGRARDLFKEAFGVHKKKNWFYRYAEAFRDERQYLYAEEKYDELLHYTASKNRRGIPEKRAVLDYAALETNYLRNYSKADQLLRRYILDYSIWDKEALIALGDNNLIWGDIEPERYENAREAYARLMERYGRTDPVLERMLRYFIRTDNLGEVLALQNHFMASSKRKIEAASLAELGGYLLDKQTEEIRGVPNEYLDRIQGIRDLLLRAIRTSPALPEAYYHLSRYYHNYNNINDEELTLQRAIQAFDAARLETSRRLGYRIDTLRRYSEMLVRRREFFQAEEYLLQGVRLYEDGLSRRVVAAFPQYGRLYADLGDLEYFAKDGNTEAALDYYLRSERNGYAPPEIQYRIGASHYQRREWTEALDRFSAASFPLPFNRRILYALGNVSYLRGNYFAAQGYYDRLLEILEADRSRFPQIMPTENEEEQELVERVMVVQNNLGVTLEALSLRTGDNSYRSRAQGLYSESERAWDILTRNPGTMARLRPSPEITAPGVNPAYLNVQNSLYPVQGYEPLFFLRIDRDVLEPSVWEELAPQGYRLSEGVSTGR